jgi:calcineurin-like phosphoesterase family protein
MIYLTSDLHFGHQRNFLYKPRGFSSIEEHDAAIIKNWNKIITPDDEVFVLGDLVMNDAESGIEKLAQLNGKLNIVFGNHDTARKIGFYEELPNVTSVGWSTLIKSGKWSFYLCHFPTMVDNFEERHKFYCLHGHTHDKNKFQFIKNCCYNVALDAHDNKPVSIEQIKADLREIRQ